LLLFSFVIVLVSCGPIFEVGGVNGNNGGSGGGGQTLPPTVGGGYKEVTAYDWLDLAEYLESDETSYNIILEMEVADIYLLRNLSIVKPMKIIGGSGNGYTIHSVNKSGGNVFCLDLQANLEMEHCGFTGYAGTTEAGKGIVAGSPPINIREGNTLTMTGRDSVLELIGVGNGTATRAGSQVKLVDNASIADSTGDLLFRAGVEKLTVSGDVTIKNELIVGSGAVLQIERDAELRVGSGATLTLDNSLKELKLDGDIIVDRTSAPGGSLVLTGSLDSLLAKIGGNGSLSVENGIPEEAVKPFVFGANTIAKFNSDGISLEKMNSSDLPAIVVIDTNANITIPKGKKLIVGVGVDFSVENELTLKGGTLDVSGNVKVNTGGIIEVSAEDVFNATPKGSVDTRGSGLITIKEGGMFIDEFLKFTASGVESSIAIKNGPVYTLSGNVDLDLTAVDSSLSGTITVEAGAVLTVAGNLSVRVPNMLNGATTTQPVPQIDISYGHVEFYSSDAATNPVSTLQVGSYKWNGSGWK
jgi:hypothetical protein